MVDKNPSARRWQRAPVSHRDHALTIRRFTDADSTVGTAPRDPAIGRPRTRPDAVRGDKAYSSRAIRSHLRDRGIKAVIPESRDQQGHRKRRGSHGGRPVGLDADDYKNRNVIERRFCHTKQWRGLATRYDKHAVVYRAAVLIHAAIAWTQQLSDMP